MKKLNWSGLTVVGLIILASCFTVSFLVKSKLNLETDFLSAAATIFTAVVAMTLYSDWREEYLINELKDQNRNIQDQSKHYSACIEDLDSFNKGLISPKKVDMVFFRVKEGLSSSYNALSQYDNFLEMIKRVDNQEHIKNIQDLQAKIFPLLVTADVKVEDNDDSRKQFLLQNHRSLLIVSRDLWIFARNDTDKIFKKLFNK